MSEELKSYYEVGHEVGEELADKDQTPVSANRPQPQEQDLAETTAWLQEQGVVGDPRLLAALIGMVHGANHPAPPEQ